jgi:hypothetical protein
MVGLVTCVWPTLIWLLLAKTIGVHYEITIKYSKPYLNSSSPNYSWFMQYMKNDNNDIDITEFPSSMNFLSETWDELISYVYMVCLWIMFSYWNQLLNFACNWFILLFVNCATMFITLKGRKWCSLIKFLLQEGAYVVVNIMLENHKYLN